ncbi:MAG: cupin domain-containing protein [Akkermansiaceae bacterium]|nr:cupin domain-containing protein [Armatimonadota bacterium]
MVSEALFPADTGSGNRSRVVEPGDGAALTVLGDRYVLKVETGETRGSLTTIEPGCGPPPHRHRREDETVYIPDGAFEFRIGDQTLQVGAGAFVYAPREQGSAHVR